MNSCKLPNNYISRSFSYLVSYTEPDPFELTFRQFIEKLNFHFSNYNKLWDEHLGLQVTYDFSETAIDETKLISLDNLGVFMQQWHDEKFGWKPNLENVRWDSKSSNQEKFFVANEIELPLKELLQIESSIHPDSFYNEKSEDVVEKIYAIDYRYWNKIDQA